MKIIFYVPQLSKTCASKLVFAECSKKRVESLIMTSLQLSNMFAFRTSNQADISKNDTDEAKKRKQNGPA